MSVPVAEKRCMIPRSTAYKLFTEFNAGDNTVLSGGSSKKKSNRGIPQKVFPGHTQFLMPYFDEHPPSIFEMAKKHLLSSLNVSQFPYKDYGSI